jgi:uncharacterized membrane protein YbhN (UPF0104 family)
VRTVVLATNLALGAAALAWVLYRHGAPALALLARAPDGALLALFVLTVAATFVAYSLRWRTLLAGVGVRRRLATLLAFRAAGQSLSSIIPSGKLGGEPLRALLLVRDAVPGPAAIATVTIDRVLEMSAAAPFACLYAVLLLRRGVPELQGALVTVTLGAAALCAGIALTARRLGRGGGVVTAVARSTGLDRLRFVRGQMDVVAAAEGDAARLIAQRGRLACAFAAGVAANLLVLVEYHLLLAAFGLPAGPLAVVAAVFATGAAHSLPIPAAVGALEGAQMWLFGILGYPAEVGLAVGLAVRLRELVWVLPGLLYLTGRAVARWRHAGTASGRRAWIAAAKKPG